MLSLILGLVYLIRAGAIIRSTRRFILQRIILNTLSPVARLMKPTIYTMRLGDCFTYWRWIGSILDRPVGTRSEKSSGLSDNVVLKPNLVVSEHPDGLLGIQASVVHGSIIRPFIDYAWIANQGRGRITIADSPIKEVDFARIIDLTGIGSTVEYLNKKHGLGIVARWIFAICRSRAIRIES